MADQERKAAVDAQEAPAAQPAADEAAPHEAHPHERHVKASTWRTLTAFALFVVVAIGLVAHTGTGTPSAWGIADIAAICPLGALEALLASKTAVPPLLIGLVITVLLVLIFGRSFCSWCCPTGLVRRIFARPASEPQPKGGKLDVEPKRRGGADDSRNWVLGGVLIAALVIGAPVFCLICPVGLTFATFIAVWRLFTLNETTWSLVVFPAILIIELVALRRWCHSFCPLGALMSLIARLNKTFRPRVAVDECLYESKGVDCHACSQACPEGIDLHDGQVSAPLNECTRCHSCSDACPVQAISFPLLEKEVAQSGPDEGLPDGSATGEIGSAERRGG